MRIRKWLIAPLLAWGFVTALAAWFWLAAVRPNQQHRRLYDDIGQTLDRLRHKRPSELRREEWAYIVGWTFNAHANCCSAREFITDYARFTRFPAELKRRLDVHVDLQTVDWIWDELEAFSRIGPRYSENFRPTRRERLREAATFRWADLEVD